MRGYWPEQAQRHTDERGETKSQPRSSDDTWFAVEQLLIPD